MTGISQTVLEAFSTLGMTEIPNTGPFYISDASIALVAGNQIVQHSVDTGERSYLFADRLTYSDFRTEKITAFSVSIDGNYVALGVNRSSTDPTFELYHVKKEILHSSIVQNKSNGIIFTAFHRTDKLLLYVSSFYNKNILTIYNYATKMVVKSVDIPFNFKSAVFSHLADDMTVIFYNSSSLYYIPSNANEVIKIDCPNYSRFTGFVYSLSEKSCCVASSGRDLLFYQDFQLKHTMTLSEDSSIIFLSSFNHGLICATESFKICLIHHIPIPNDISKSFQQGPCVSYGFKYPVVWASFSQCQNQIVCDIDNRQLILVNIRELELGTESSIINPNIVSHKGPIIAISICAYKPMLVSCGGEDKTVIVWDYSKQTSVLFCEFQEELTDVSFHPSGDLIAVASTEKLYLFAVTVDSLINVAQWPLFNCLSIQFSNGGHFLVAASHIITFINPYTQEIITTLRGHTGLVHSLSWSPDDKRLVSCGSDGKVIEWNGVTQEINWELQIDETEFVSSVITERGTILACSQSNLIHHLFNKRQHHRINEELTTKYTSVLFLSPSCIAVGDSLGGVQLVQFPFVVPQVSRPKFGNVPQLEFAGTQDPRFTTEPIPFQGGQIYTAHLGCITRLCVSLDSRVLFTSSSDSSVCVFNVLQTAHKFTQPKITVLRCDVPRQQFFLVQQTKYDELQRVIEKLKIDIQRQRSTYEAETIETLQAHQRNLADLTMQHNERKEKLCIQLQNLRDAIDDSTVQAALIYQNMENSHLGEAKTLTNIYEQKLGLEQSKCDILSKEVEDLRCSYEERVYILQQQYKDSMEGLSNNIVAKRDQLAQDLINTNNEIQASDDRMRDRMINLEVEFGKDKMAAKLEYHTKKQELEKLERDLNDKCKGLEEEIRKQELKLDKKRDKLNEAKEERAKLDKEIKQQEHLQECKTSELHDRDETLLRQELRLEQLQRSNQELTKFREIMDYRIAEMSRDLQPSRDEIARLKSELNGTDEEISNVKRVVQTNHRTMKDKALHIEVLKNKLIDAKTVLEKKKRVIQVFSEELKEDIKSADCLAYVKNLHEKYVLVTDIENNIKDENGAIKDQTRQRRQLQENVLLLQKSAKQQKSMMDKHFKTKSIENTQLILDLNELQKENRTLITKLELIKSDVDMVNANLKRIRQTRAEQIQKRLGTVRSSLGPRPLVTSDWVKNRVGSSVTVVDGRGKYLHNK